MESSLAKFSRDGYFVAKGLLSPTAIDHVRNSIYKSYQDQVALLTGPQQRPASRSDMKALFDIDQARYRKVSGALWRKLDVYDALHSQSVTGFLRSEFG